MHVATTLVWCGITDEITLDEFTLSIKLSDLAPALEIVGKLITDAFDTGEEVKKKQQVVRVINGVGQKLKNSLMVFQD